jgi:MoaA/NifB/PqqE/SkfB family radical SAM enzyme
VASCGLSSVACFKGGTAMVEIIGEFSKLSKIKVAVERKFPKLYEYCYLHPGYWVYDIFNGIITRKEINLGPRLNLIEIETLNRCNGDCQFCPVNKKDDPRLKIEMREELFRNIIDQLHDMHFTGQINLQSNSEGLLDKRIWGFMSYARARLPDANIVFFTNGYLLNYERLDFFMKHISHLYLDNYNDKSEFNPASRMALLYINDHPEFSSKLTILVTRKDMKRGSRGGLVKNRIFQHLNSPCIYPWVQMIIRPDGKLSLCCNDAIGSVTLGDLTRQNILDAWNGPEYQRIREKMLRGRQEIFRCRNCDSCVNRPKALIKIRRFMGGS